MENKNLEQQVLEMNSKLDFITEVMKDYQKRHRELLELKEDLTHIGKDVFQVATKEFEEVSHHFDSADLMNLLKKLMRNVRTLNGMLDQLESASDFFRDATPLGKQVFEELLETFNELEKKGYFEFFREIVGMLDTVVSSFTLGDVKLLRENIISILLTIKNITQPEMLSAVNNAVSFYRKMDIIVDQDISYWSLLKELKDPETRRGMAFMIQFLKNMSSSNGKNEHNLKSELHTKED